MDVIENVNRKDKGISVKEKRDSKQYKKQENILKKNI